MQWYIFLLTFSLYCKFGYAWLLVSKLRHIHIIISLIIRNMTWDSFSSSKLEFFAGAGFRRCGEDSLVAFVCYLLFGLVVVSLIYSQFPFWIICNKFTVFTHLLCCPLLYSPNWHKLSRLLKKKHDQYHCTAILFTNNFSFPILCALWILTNMDKR